MWEVIFITLSYGSEIMTNENVNMMTWAAAESKKIEEERIKKMKEKGQNPYYEWKNGENKFTIKVDIQPRDKYGDYGPQKIFQVETESGIFDLSMNVSNPVYRKIIKSLAEGKTKFNVQRSGQGKKKAYELLDAQ